MWKSRTLNLPGTILFLNKNIIQVQITNTKRIFVEIGRVKCDLALRNSNRHYVGDKTHVKYMLTLIMHGEDVQNILF